MPDFRAKIVAELDTKKFESDLNTKLANKKVTLNNFTQLGERSTVIAFLNSLWKFSCRNFDTSPPPCPSNIQKRAEFISFFIQSTAFPLSSI